MKPPNNGHERPAEAVEGRRLAKGNAHQHTMVRTQRRVRMPHELERGRHVARRERKRRFTTLLPHGDHLDTLRRASFGLKRAAAPGIDGVTWQQYGEHLEDNLQERAGRLQRGAYQAKPTRRSDMANVDGRQRPLGIPALEDTIVQSAGVEVLKAVYEGDFRGFSSGCRPGRTPHEALDALSVGRERRKVNGVLNIDIRGFFDAMVHGWLVQFLEHRIAN